MKIDKEKIEELKKTHGDLFKARVLYKDEDQVQHSIEFVHRKPRFEDYERFQKDVVRMGSAIANQNLITGLVIHPASADVSAQLSACPIAADQWIMKNVLPYFGGDIEEVSSSKL